MKSFISLFALAALLALPMGSHAAAPAPSAISAVSYHSVSAITAGSMQDNSTSSFFYTDGAGRLTNFEMKSDGDVMTLTIRQDGLVMWSRAFKTRGSNFAVSRRESLGRVYFYITAGSRHFEAEPNEKGEWDVTPVGKGRRVVPL